MACMIFECASDDQIRPIIEWALLILSGLFLLYHLPKMLAYILSLLTRPCRSNPINKPISKDYAIITGASDGIGLEYAKQLAAKGYNLFLISRTMSKLEAAKNEIMEKNRVDIQLMAADFTATDIYDPIRSRIKLLSGRAAVLVNNVGMMNSSTMEFADIDNPEYNNRLLICNTLSVVKMCEIVLPIMKEQRAGVVINISSNMGIMAFPYFALYSSTKAFVSHLTKCLQAEYSGYGITIQDVAPNQVETNMSVNLRSALYGVPVKSFVRYALGSVGKESYTSAHPKHKFLNNSAAFMNGWLPYGVNVAIMKPMLRSLTKGSHSKVHP